MTRRKAKQMKYNKTIQQGDTKISTNAHSLITTQDISELTSYCTATIQQFQSRWGVTKGYTFIPGTTDTTVPDRPKVLAVAHLDCYSSKFYIENNNIHSAALDDRLGVWAICRKLPTLVDGGRFYDILLTTGEEKGKSTASDFYDMQGTDNYNWIFEIDRHGCDAVRYGFTDPIWIAALEADGWDVKHGSFTDICEFDDGGTSAVNFGIGYQAEHTVSCYVPLRTLELQLMRIAYFYNHHKDTKFTHDAYTPSPVNDYMYNYPSGWSVENQLDIANDYGQNGQKKIGTGYQGYPQWTTKNWASKWSSKRGTK